MFAQNSFLFFTLILRTTFARPLTFQTLFKTLAEIANSFVSLSSNIELNSNTLIRPTSRNLRAYANASLRTPAGYILKERISLWSFRSESLENSISAFSCLLARQGFNWISQTRDETTRKHSPKYTFPSIIVFSYSRRIYRLSIPRDHRLRRYRVRRFTCAPGEEQRGTFPSFRVFLGRR